MSDSNWTVLYEFDDTAEPPHGWSGVWPGGTSQPDYDWRDTVAGRTCLNFRGGPVEGFSARDARHKKTNRWTYTATLGQWIRFEGWCYVSAPIELPGVKRVELVTLQIKDSRPRSDDNPNPYTPLWYLNLGKHPGLWGHNLGAKNWDASVETPIRKWTHFAFDYLPNPGRDGRVRLWMDGELVLGVVNVRTIMEGMETNCLLQFLEGSYCPEDGWCMQEGNDLAWSDPQIRAWTGAPAPPAPVLTPEPQPPEPPEPEEEWVDVEFEGVFMGRMRKID